MWSMYVSSKNTSQRAPESIHFILEYCSHGTNDDSTPNSVPSFNALLLEKRKSRFLSLVYTMVDKKNKKKEKSRCVYITTTMWRVDK